MITDKTMFEYGGWVRSNRKPVGMGYPTQTVIYRMMQLGINQGVINYDTYIPPLDYIDFQEIDNAIEQLSGEDKMLVNQRYVQRMRPQKIADKWKITRATVYNRLEKIQKRLDSIMCSVIHSG